MFIITVPRAVCAAVVFMGCGVLVWCGGMVYEVCEYVLWSVVVWGYGV